MKVDLVPSKKEKKSFENVSSEPAILPNNLRNNLITYQLVQNVVHICNRVICKYKEESTGSPKEVACNILLRTRAYLHYNEERDREREREGRKEGKGNMERYTPK